MSTAEEDAPSNWGVHAIFKTLTPPPSMHNEKLLSATDRNGQLPLHTLCYCINDVGYMSVLQRMIAVNPDALRHPDKNGSLPLHRAVHRSDSNSHAAIPIDALCYIVDSYPEAARIPNKQNNWALHLACEDMNPSLAVVQKLVEVYPEAIKKGDNHAGRIPLHAAAAWDSTGAIFGFLLEQWPDGAMKLDPHYGKTPVHTVLSLASNEVFVRSIARIKPAAFNIRDRAGVLPLLQVLRHHHRWTIPIDTARLVLQHTADEHISTDFGRLIDAAQDFGRGELVLDLSQRIVAIGKLPVHLALETGVQKKDALKFVMTSVRQQGLSQTDNAGRFPIHIAAMMSFTGAGDIIQFLIDQNPDSVRHADKVGSLPIHYYVTATTTHRPDADFFLVLKSMVEAFPASVTIPDRYEDCGLMPALSFATRCSSGSSGSSPDNRKRSRDNRAAARKKKNKNNKRLLALEISSIYLLVRSSFGHEKSLFHSNMLQDN